MNHIEAAREIAELIPQTKRELEDHHKKQDAFTVIRVFTLQLKELLRRTDSRIISRALEKINRIYTQGDQMLRNAVESIFIYSLDSITASCKPEMRQTMMQQMHPALLRKYHQQFYKSGI